MDDKQFIAELQQAIANNDTLAELQRDQLVQEITVRAGAYQQDRQHWRGIALVDRKMENDASISVLWSNYANSLRLLEDYAAAYTALERAWDLLPPEQAVAGRSALLERALT